MNSIIAAGFEQKGHWHDFLTKGVYDPRLFYYIGAFFINSDYCHAARNETRKFGYRKKYAESYIKHLSRLRDNNQHIDNIPNRYINQELCSTIQDLTTLLQIPCRYRTFELCQVMFKKSKKEFRNIPHHCMTQEMCFEAIQWSGTMMKYVPEKFRTYELWLKAVKKLGKLFFYAPEEFKTKELSMAMRYKHIHIPNMPDKFKTREFYLSALHESNKALPFIPDEFKAEFQN